MTVFLPILVCLCGGVGAPCRYLLDVTIKTYWQRALSSSTFTTNLITGFLAGLITALALGGTLDEPWRLVLATGFLGSFSTFPTAINEMVTLFCKHRYPTVVAYLVSLLGVPVVAVACGFLVWPPRRFPARPTVSLRGRTSQVRPGGAQAWQAMERM